MTTHLLRKTHPLVLTAAVAVTLFSILGSATVMRLLPLTHAQSAPLGQTALRTSSDSDKSAAAQQAFRSRVAGQEATSAEAAVKPVATKHTSSTPASTPHNACRHCGVVESIRMVEQDGTASGLGAVAGGVAGGVLGNQLGHGRGNTLMTILGIGGGAYAGHALEKTMKKTVQYVIKVRLHDGSYRTVTQPTAPDYAVGDHVKVVSGRVTVI